MKITKRQIRKIIKEAMSDDFYEFRHQEEQKDLEDLRADVIFEIIEANQEISGPQLVNMALRNSVFGGAEAESCFKICSENSKSHFKIVLMFGVSPCRSKALPQLPQ